MCLLVINRNTASIRTGVVSIWSKSGAVSIRVVTQTIAAFCSAEDSAGRTIRCLPIRINAVIIRSYATIVIGVSTQCGSITSARVQTAGVPTLKAIIGGIITMVSVEALVVLALSAVDLPDGDQMEYAEEQLVTFHAVYVYQGYLFIR